MGFSGLIGNLLQQYAGSGGSGTNPAAAPEADTAHQHYDQVAQHVDSSTLASGLGAMMRSPDTPAFGQIVGQLFGSGNGEQKAGMLNTLLAGASPALLSQLSALIPGLGSGGSVSPQQAQAIPPDAVTQMAAQAETHDPSIVDKMSSLYAEHPTLVKTLGTGAMIVALREIGKKFSR